MKSLRITVELPNGSFINSIDYELNENNRQVLCAKLVRAVSGEGIMFQEFARIDTTVAIPPEVLSKSITRLIEIEND